VSEDALALVEASPTYSDEPPPALRVTPADEPLSAKAATYDDDPDQFRSLVETTGDALLIADFAGKVIVDANRAACELTGYTLNELRAIPPLRLLAPAEHETLDGGLRDLERRGRVWHPSLCMRRKDGSYFFGEVRITLYGPPSRRLAAAIVRDVSERLDRETEIRRSYEALREAQESLARSEEKYRALVEVASDAIVILDLESDRFIEVNRAACEMLGYSTNEFRFLSEHAVFHDTALTRSLRLIQSEPGWKPNVRMRRKDGSGFWAEVHAASYQTGGRGYTMAIIRDVTWRVEREEELAASYCMLEDTQAKLVQASKLSAMGEIGAGIAHELNQPITIIQGFAQRICRHPEVPIRQHLDELLIIVDEAKRMAHIVDNIRTFARQSNFEPEPIDPLTPLQNALELLKAQLKVLGIDVTLAADDPLPQIEADRARLQQVFLNLIVNARDALGELAFGKPKQIRIRVDDQGDSLSYEIEDTGPGIPAEVRERVFEPFYTSKDPGQGTGLGLSIAYGIVQDHKGEIKLEQAAGGGARFIIRLPTIKAPNSTGAEA
jgi:PAS domain S-box-containing protein